jgi:carboxynorspermidine decarboxylase
MSIDHTRHMQARSQPYPGCNPDWVGAVSTTPAFVYDEARLLKNLELLNQIRSGGGCRVLYSVKAFPFAGLLKRIRGLVDGFSVSSLFEARLGHEVLDGAGTLHITTPGFQAQEMAEIGRLCDYVSFNSLNQLSRLAPHIDGAASAGLRINPQLSFLDDPRYDPCRPYSKLGAPLPQVVDSCQANGIAAGIGGLHFHSHFGSRSCTPLLTSVRHIEAHLPQLVRNIDWVNLGGGYLFSEEGDLNALRHIVDHINTTWGAEVFIEPGKAIIENTGFLVSSVIDTFVSDGKNIAVLDTSVNHLPEVFEYQTRPELLGQPVIGAHAVTLAGGTCLSGDLFGDYRFPRPLEIGDRVVFRDVGAYSLIKASRFNGHNLPSIHFLRGNGKVELLKQYGYEDYHRQWSDLRPARQPSQSGAE